MWINCVTKARRQRAVALKKQGLSYRAIAKELRMGKETVKVIWWDYLADVRSGKIT